LFLVEIFGLAAIIIPNVSGFIGTGNLNAANTELQNVKTGALGYYGQHGTWPDNSGDLVNFIDLMTKATYTFDPTTGFVAGSSGETGRDSPGLPRRVLLTQKMASGSGSRVWAI
jgi:hypothetical protein